MYMHQKIEKSLSANFDVPCTLYILKERVRRETDIRETIHCIHNHVITINVTVINGWSALQERKMRKRSIIQGETELYRTIIRTHSNKTLYNKEKEIHFN